MAGDNLLLISKLRLESSVVCGDPCGVAAVWVMIGGKPKVEADSRYNRSCSLGHLGN